MQNETEIPLCSSGSTHQAHCRCHAHQLSPPIHRQPFLHTQRCINAVFKVKMLPEVSRVAHDWKFHHLITRGVKAEEHSLRLLFLLLFLSFGFPSKEGCCPPLLPWVLRGGLLIDLHGTADRISPRHKLGRAATHTHRQSHTQTHRHA